MYIQARRIILIGFAMLLTACGGGVETLPRVDPMVG